MRVFLPLKIVAVFFFSMTQSICCTTLCTCVGDDSRAALFALLPFPVQSLGQHSHTGTQTYTHTCAFYNSSVATSCLFFWFFMSIFPRHTCDSKLCVYVAVPVWQFECAAFSQIERFGKALSTWPSNGGQNNYNNFSWSLWGHLNGLYSLDLHV